MLHAVLANIQTESVGVVRPRAPRTVEATVLVIHDEERTESLRRLPGTREHAGDAARRAPSGRRMVVLMSSVVVIRDRAATECWLTRDCAQHPLFSVCFVKSRWHSESSVVLNHCQAPDQACQPSCRGATFSVKGRV